MNTTYYKKSIPSPFQVMQKRAFDVQDPQHPVRKEIMKNIGTINLTATIEEDRDTLSLLKNIPGLIAYMCSLRMDGELISIGRGTATLNRINKFLERTVVAAKNASLVDSVVRATRVLDVLRPDAELAPNKENTAPSSRPYQPNDIPASEKQKSYLLQLIENNVTDEDERNQWEQRLENGISKNEASEAIQSFKK